MIKRAAIVLEIAFGLVWILLFTECLNLLDQPSNLDVGLGTVLLLGSAIVFPTVMINVWKRASRHFAGREEKKNEESTVAVGGSRSGDSERLHTH